MHRALFCFKISVGWPQSACWCWPKHRKKQTEAEKTFPVLVSYSSRLKCCFHCSCFYIQNLICKNRSKALWNINSHFSIINYNALLFTSPVRSTLLLHWLETEWLMWILFKDCSRPSVTLTVNYIQLEINNPD